MLRDESSELHVHLRQVYSVERLAAKTELYAHFARWFDGGWVHATVARFLATTSETTQSAEDFIATCS